MVTELYYYTANAKNTDRIGRMSFTWDSDRLNPSRRHFVREYRQLPRSLCCTTTLKMKLHSVYRCFALSTLDTGSGTGNPSNMPWYWRTV